MDGLGNLRTLSWRRSPLRVAAAWPDDARLCMLHNGRFHDRWSRWSILACPKGFARLDDDLRWRFAGAVPERLTSDGDPLEWLDRLCPLRDSATGQ